MKEHPLVHLSNQISKKNFFWIIISGRKENKMPEFKMVYQLDEMDCGPSCLAMIAKHYGKEFSLSYVREISHLTKNGVSLLGISQAAETLGFETISAKTTLLTLKGERIFPCIIHWKQSHFVVLYKVKRSRFTKEYFFYLADPAYGLMKLSEESFRKGWLGEEIKGVTMFLNPTDKFFSLEEIKESSNFYYLFNYIKPFKWQIIKIFFGLFIGSLITLAFPFLTQYLVDKGINTKDLHFVILVLIAQLTLFFGNSVIEIIRNRIMLYVGTRLNINIISDFLGKLMLMPLKFFDAKRIGDLMQRIQDHKRIEIFLTSNSILTLFSLINFSVFFGVLLYYNWLILLIYIILTAISIIWVLFFLKKRKILDYNRFDLLAENQDTTYELVTGMQEIKLNDFETFKKEKWKTIQEKLFKVNIKVLTIDQFQLSGYDFINNLKNIVVSFIAANYVIINDITLGAMLSISYIIGEMNSPIAQLIAFFRSMQDAKLSFSRLNEIHNIPLENYEIEHDTKKESFDGIKINNLSFQYEGKRSPFALKNVNLIIPKGKVTAIVGASGSGKTTLLKLILKYYKPTDGNIYIEGKNLTNIPLENWRKQFGVVMQDGFIFSETIERNIATSDNSINKKKLQQSVLVANLTDCIQNLALGLKTEIGASGTGISGGQRQRILIARAVYKNPQYIFFDEATSALDAENEKKIHDNLQEFFKGKTVLIIAHRLSTVKNADLIIVLKNGQIAEQGTHNQLVASKREYFSLIKNQLELGN
jgi:ATP-binding cassette subfamily B protein